MPPGWAVRPGACDEARAGPHAASAGHGLGSGVVVPDDGKDFPGVQNREGVIPAGPGGLRGIALVPAAFPEQIAHFQDALPRDGRAVLPGQAALADHFAGQAAFRFERHGPEAEAVFTVALQLPVQPLPGLGLAEGVGVGVHHLRVAQHGAERGEVVRRHFPQDQARRFQNQTRVHTIMIRTGRNCRPGCGTPAPRWTPHRRAAERLLRAGPGTMSVGVLHRRGYCAARGGGIPQG